MDFYVILGLDRGATLSEIKRAYRRLARKYHPDINPGDHAAESFFRQIVEAYETLSDPERRRAYDVHGTRQAVTGSTSFEFQGFDFSHATQGPDASTFGDLFEDMFRRSEGRAAAEKPADGADLHCQVTLSFEEAMRGVPRPVTITRLDTCGACSGTGSLRAGEGRCGHCHGKGSVGWARGHMVFTKSCSHCGGSGRLRQRPCTTCVGDGVMPRTETVTVQLPAGVSDDMRIRVPGKGNAGRQGGRTGDLYIVTEVVPHPLFRREGDDLHLVAPIAIHEAALGSKIDVPTIDGPGRVRIPPGTQSGQRFRLRGRGAPSPRDGRRGDLVVEVKIVLPPLTDERSKELLREFGRINNENVRKDLGV